MPYSIAWAILKRGGKRLTKVRGHHDFEVFSRKKDAEFIADQRNRKATKIFILIPTHKLDEDIVNTLFGQKPTPGVRAYRGDKLPGSNTDKGKRTSRKRQRNRDR